MFLRLLCRTDPHFVSTAVNFCKYPKSTLNARGRALPVLPIARHAAAATRHQQRSPGRRPSGRRSPPPPGQRPSGACGSPGIRGTRRGADPAGSGSNPSESEATPAGSRRERGGKDPSGNVWLCHHSWRWCRPPRPCLRPSCSALFALKFPELPHSLY